MKRSYFFLFVALLAISTNHGLIAQNADSIITVQAFSFGDEPTLHAWGNIYEYDGMVQFPQPGGRYEKILMYYTLKCDGATKADVYACGEWDYSTWTRVWDDSANHWEIGRFITPYGKGLSLGSDGFTWVFDVTDYAPVLTGLKRMTSGNSQELLDLKFVFIKGVPERDPLTVQRLWEPGSPSYQGIVDGSLLAPQEIELNPNAAMYRINTRPQGGNFNGGDSTDNCAEFCDREHWITVNGTERFRWNVWKVCGSNPVFPQGGTWIYDRAGWCPGAIVETQHHELTPFVTPGDVVTIDYGIDNPPQYKPYGHWVFWADLISYSAPNFRNQASVEEILSPNTDDLYGRMNPVCSSPVIRIRNGGSEPLASLTITYGIEGGDQFSYVWTGQLAFLEEQVVTLPPMPASIYENDGNEFFVRTSKPNGKEDEYQNNDRRTSHMMRPDRVPASFTVSLKTNNLKSLFGVNYTIDLRDADGNVVWENRDPAPNSTITKEFALPPGCYSLNIVNPASAGLGFWAFQPDLTTGALSILSDGAVVKDFGIDFGRDIHYQFQTPAPELGLNSDTVFFPETKTGTTRDQTFVIRPANAAGLTVYSLTMFTGRNSYEIAATRPAIDSSGRLIPYGDSMEVDMKFTPAEIKAYSGRIIASTSDYHGNRTIYLSGMGSIESASVPLPGSPGSTAQLRVVPNILKGKGSVVIASAGKVPGARVELVDLSGEFIAELYHGILSHDDQTIPYNVSMLATGTYFLVLRNAEGKVVEAERVQIVN